MNEKEIVSYLATLTTDSENTLRALTRAYWAATYSNSKLMIEIISERRYGEPKLKMPKELKGVKKAGTVPYGSKCACPVYITTTHIYIKHRDWFSPCISKEKAKAAGIIGDWNKKFIYNDCFGSIVLRCEAWLRMPLLMLTLLHGLIPAMELCMELERTLELKECTLCNHDWQHMFEELIKLCNPYLPHRHKVDTYSPFSTNFNS